MMDVRYARQCAVTTFGTAGQTALERATVAIVGCGALGCAHAMLLARMGVRCLRLADFDTVSLNNLHRQVLFTEADAAAARLKVVAATEALRGVNRTVALEPCTERITATSVVSFFENVDLVLDATDDVATRYVINDACHTLRTPWVYTGVAGNIGTILPVRPRHSACLRCVFPKPPAADGVANVATRGILPPTVMVGAALQVAQGIRLLMGETPTSLIHFDVWSGVSRAVAVSRNPECACVED